MQGIFTPLVNSSKNIAKLTKNGKVLFSASVEDTNKMLSAGSNKFYGTQSSKVPGQNKKLFLVKHSLQKKQESKMKKINYDEEMMVITIGLINSKVKQG